MKFYTFATPVDSDTLLCMNRNITKRLAISDSDADEQPMKFTDKSRKLLKTAAPLLRKVGNKGKASAPARSKKRQPIAEEESDSESEDDQEEMVSVATNH